jgi:hypothetical protein
MPSFRLGDPMPPSHANASIRHKFDMIDPLRFRAAALCHPTAYGIMAGT